MEIQLEKRLENAIEILFTNFESPQCDSEIIATINKTLKNSKTRIMGLELIQVIISRCPQEIVMENVLTWSDYCTVLYTEDAMKEVKLKTLAIIIKSVSSIELLNKKFTAEFLSNVLKACLNCQSVSERIVALQCLTNCMKKFPIWFGNHKDKIESYLTECLDSPVLAPIAAQCFMVFLEIGPAGVNGINYVNNFTNNYKKLYCSLHSLYNKFLKYFPQIENKVKIDGDIFHYKSKNENPDLIFNRIISTSTFLKTMILKQFPVEKRFAPFYVIDIVQRGITVNFCFCKNSELKHIAILLKKLYHHSLDLLRVFIQTFTTISKPYSLTIQNIFLNALRKSGQCKCAELDFYYKTSIYKTMNLWFSKNKIVNETQTMEKLLPIILKDISSSKKDVVLKTKTPEAKKTLRENFVENIRSELFCFTGLQALETLLKSSLNVDHNLLKQVLDFIISTLDAILVDKTDELYNNTRCQMKLYDVLLAIFSLVNIKNLPSLHWLISILNKGMVSSNWRIAQKCSECLEIIEKVSHPICPTLYIPETTMEGEPPMEFILEETFEELEVLPQIVEYKPEEIVDDISEPEEVIDLTEDQTGTVPVEIAEPMEVTETVKAPSSEISVEAPIDDTLEDMFSSFKDSVQE